MKRHDISCIGLECSFLAKFPYDCDYYCMMVLCLQYAIFGKVTKGDETLTKLEELPTRKEGIFVMVRC